MRNVISPRAVSFEDALRNLAAKLTGLPAKELPRTQEAIDQYMAENVPSVADLTETITQEVMSRLAEMAAGDAEETSDAENGKEPEQPAEPEDGTKAKTGGKSRKSE